MTNKKFRIILSVTIILCLKLKGTNSKKRDRLLREDEKRHFFNQLIIPCHLISSHFYLKKIQTERVTNHAIADARRELWPGLF